MGWMFHAGGVGIWYAERAQTHFEQSKVWTVPWWEEDGVVCAIATESCWLLVSGIVGPSFVRATVDAFSYQSE